MLFVHGTSDDVVSCQGQVAGRWPGHASVEEGAARWAEINGCGDERTTVETLDLVRDIAGQETQVADLSGLSCRGVGGDLVDRGWDPLPVVRRVVGWRGVRLAPGARQDSRVSGWSDGADRAGEVCP